MCLNIYSHIATLNFILVFVYRSGHCRSKTSATSEEFHIRGQLLRALFTRLLKKHVRATEKHIRKKRIPHLVGSKKERPRCPRNVWMPCFNDVGMSPTPQAESARTKIFLLRENLLYIRKSSNVNTILRLLSSSFVLSRYYVATFIR